MDIYKKLYLTLFNRMTDVIDALDAQKYELARDMLIQAQQDAEVCFLDEAPTEQR